MDVEALRAEYDHCFGCGASNPIGLRLDEFRPGEDGVTATFTPRSEFAGFADALHGGIITTALDEVSAWAAMLTEGVLVFTATLEVRFRRPAPPDASYSLSGTVRERSGRRLKIDGTMSDADSTVVAASSGLFVVAEDATERLLATNRG